MIISIIQPGFLPWLGFFEQMAIADLFVYLDDAQYTKGDWRNRNRLKSPSGIKTITVPVKKGGSNKLINEIKISYEMEWQSRIIRQIEYWYGKAPFFHDYFPVVKRVLLSRYENLVDLDLALIKEIRSLLRIDTPIYRSSDQKNKSFDKNQKLLDICGYHGADIFFDGKAAQDFIDMELFRKNGIDMIFQDYQHLEYPQLFGMFIPFLSVLDLLLNCGPDSRNILLSSPLPGPLQANVAKYSGK